MPGRTQCEAEALVEAQANEMEKFERDARIIGFAALLAGNPIAAGVAGAFALGFDQAAKAGHRKARALEEGCKQEIRDAAKKAAADTANSGTVLAADNHHAPKGDEPQTQCGEIYVPGSGSGAMDSNGDPLVTGGKWISVCAPIVLDLDGDGIEYVTITVPITTDTEHDGRTEQRAWVSGDDGVLFWDANGDGLGDHHETVLSGFVEGAQTDLDALLQFDSNHDGVIDANDPYYAQLKVGRDLNQDGTFQANEVFTLAQLGIASIKLVDGVQTLGRPDMTAEIAPGVVEYNRGQFVRTNGTVGTFADAALQEKDVRTLVYSDGSVNVISYGTAYAWQQKGAAGVFVNLATASYAGYTNFVDFVGGDGNDVVYGTGATNVLYGAGGTDTLLGYGGDDVIVADAADFAGGQVDGGLGRDSLMFDGTTGLSLDAYSRSFEVVLGGSGDDYLWVSVSTLGADGVTFLGGDGNDTLSGGDGNDFLAGGNGYDTLNAGNGDDTVQADDLDLLYGNVQGGAGYDLLALETAASVTVDAYARGFEIVFGNSGNDYLYSSSTNYLGQGEVLYGLGGNDTITGGGGNDYLDGGLGSDSISGGYGNDIVVIDRYDSLAGISGGANSDSLIFDDTTSLYVTNLWNMGFESVTGGDGNDTIYASRTDSYYYLEKADNFLAGGKGNDFLFGGAGQDVYTWNPGDGSDVFSDRDYGEYYGDVVHLGEGVAAGEVTIKNVGGVQSIVVSGVGAGSMQLIGFAAQYGATDKLVVEGIAYDLKWLLNTASLYGNEGILLTTRLPASYGDGGGYTPPPPGPPPPPPPPSGGGGGYGGGGGGGGQIPPVILDLDGDGFELIAAKKSGIYFDWDGDGVREQTGWAGPDDGFLVFDRDGDGRITHADEISFGVSGGKKGPFVSDLEGLRAFDTNGNGSLDGGDADFSQFGVWRDADSDAVVDPGELQSLASIGLVALSLDGYQTGDKMKPNENFIYATANAVLGDRTIDVADVFLAYDDRPSHAAAGGHYAMPDAPPELLAAGVAIA